MRNLLTFTGACLLVVATSRVTQAVQLGSGTLEISTGVGGFDIPFTNRFEVTTSIESNEVPGLGFFPSVDDPVIFKGTVITPNDVGRTITASGGTDPQFNNFVSFLTNGKNNLIFIQYKEIDGFAGGGVGTIENYFTSSPTRIDFFGDAIDSISLKIDSLEVSRTVLENGFINSSFFAKATLSINGQPSSTQTVPEPTSLMGLMMFGGLSTILRLKSLSR